MKVHTLTCPHIDYPVGENIGHIMTFTKMAAEVINREYPGKRTLINVICRGSSGAILAAVLCTFLNHRIKAKIVHIKKPNEDSHSGIVSGVYEIHGLNLIIDDFMASGDTIRSIYDVVHKRYNYISDRKDLQIDWLILNRGSEFQLGAVELNFKPINFVVGCSG